MTLEVRIQDSRAPLNKRIFPEAQILRLSDGCTKEVFGQADPEILEAFFEITPLWIARQVSGLIGLDKQKCITRGNTVYHHSGLPHFFHLN